MKTKVILLLCLSLGIVWSQLSAQKNTKQDDYTKLGAPASVTDKMNGKVQKVVLKLYWCAGTGENLSMGKRITTRERDSLGWFYDFEATFDNVGDHIIDYNTLDDNNKPFSMYQFKRENGQIVSSKWTFGKTIRTAHGSYSKGEGYTKFTYNEKGQLIRTEDYKASGDSLMYSFKLTSNELGDQTEGQAFDSKGNFIRKWTISYNGKRQVIGGNWTGKDEIIAGSYSNIYNDKGKVSEATYFDKDKKVTVIHKYTYPEYDARGNWLKLLYKNNMGQSLFCERTITYF